MTQIGDLTIDVPVSYRRSGYSARMMGSMDDSDGFNQLRELFAKTDLGSAIHRIPGDRPLGEDLTDELRNTKHCIFTHGTTGKVQDGYYLLRPAHSFIEDETPIGHSYVWSIVLFFIGTYSFYQDGYRMKELAVATVNDWAI